MKIHFATSQEPIRFGTDLRAVCGQTIPQAYSLLGWDEGLVQPDYEECLSGLNRCQTCQAIGMTQRYCSAIVAGQESVDAKLGRKENSSQQDELVSTLEQ